MLKTYLVQVAKSKSNEDFQNVFIPGVDWEGSIFTRDKIFIVLSSVDESSIHHYALAKGLELESISEIEELRGLNSSRIVDYVYRRPIDLQSL
ncbi:MAG: hypothetical protein AB7I27_12670 [Bacteriovoracaceae bacterium]